MNQSENIFESYQLSIDLVCEILQQEYNEVHGPLNTLFVDLIGLFEGRWPAYESCQVRYHNLDHAMDVALAVARMTAGWNKVNEGERIPHEIFLAGMAAALFHDTGYIKDRGDTEGSGGKYTFNHVDRSIRLSRNYLQNKKWPEATIELVAKLIIPTDFHKKLDISKLFTVHSEEIMARMVATGDLVAQMADVDYVLQINNLFEEFQEAYKYETLESLTERGVQVYTSAKEIIDGTLTFYEQFVVPRLENLGRMDRYLVAFFEDGRNPYQENIAANLSGQLIFKRSQWHRLGEIFEKLGIVSHDQVERAIEHQLLQEGGAGKIGRNSVSMKSSRLMAWMNKRLSSHRLGEILMDMEIIGSDDLCQGLLTQILPSDLVETLSRDELIFLLRVSVLLQNSNQGSQVFDNILEMTNAFLGCEASVIRLVDHDTGEMFVAVPVSGENGNAGVNSCFIDKGLAGWVYRHGKAVSINNVHEDGRFFFSTIGSSEHHLRSILVVPFHINGEWVGVFELMNKQDDLFIDHDTEIVTCLINIIGSVLGNTLLRF